MNRSRIHIPQPQHPGRLGRALCRADAAFDRAIQRPFSFLVIALGAVAVAVFAWAEFWRALQ